MDNAEVVSQLENLREVLRSERLQAKHNEVPAMERSSANNTYVNVYSAPHFYWEKCFPQLYPYGRGGPSDPYFRMDTMRNYHRHILLRGGGRDGRRFQSCAAHIFATYTYEIKSKVGNMAYAATRNEDVSTSRALTSKAVVSTLVECLANANEEEELDLDVLYERTKQQRNTVDGSSRAEDMVVNDAEVLTQVKGLATRLVPFAKQAPGTDMHMSYCRKNMLAMITACVITLNANWRWFTTFTYSDSYESRLYENTLNPLDAPHNWEDREAIVAKYDKSTRQRILRAHPALTARIFHEKQECLWNDILMGHDHPVGVIEDYMRRVEVR